MFDLFGNKKLALEVAALKQSITDNKSLELLPDFAKAQTANLQSFITNYNVASYPQWAARQEVSSYVEIDDVYSIISLLARSAATIPFYGFKVTNDEALKSFIKEPYHTIQKKYYQLKSMEDLPEGDPVAKLLDSLDYETKCFLYTLIFINGEVFLWKERIKYGANKGVYKLHLLFPTEMTVFISTSFPQQVTSYRYITPYGENINFDPDEIIHIKYCNPKSMYNQQFRGMSPLTPFQKRLSRIEGSMDTSVAQMQNGGVPGIVWDEVGAGTKEAKEVGDQRKIAFAGYLNNTANKGAPYFSSGKLGYIALGLKLVDLDLVALSKEDFSKLCNGYHISTVLLNDNTTSTNNNIELQSKRMFTNGILPTVYQTRDCFIKGLLYEFDGPKRYIECDLSGVTELQPDMKVQAEALKIMTWITNNEKRRIQRFDDSDEPLMDSIIIDSGQMLLSDLEAPVDDGTITE